MACSSWRRLYLSAHQYQLFNGHLGEQTVFDSEPFYPRAGNQSLGPEISPPSMTKLKNGLRGRQRELLTSAVMARKDMSFLLNGDPSIPRGFMGTKQEIAYTWDSTVTRARPFVLRPSAYELLETELK
jgi:hypothetical protein